jgi:hypothetical protein
MSDQRKQPSYTAPPGVVLLKATVPYDHAATVAALTSGIPEKVGVAAPTQYARAPAGDGISAGTSRPLAVQTISR